MVCTAISTPKSPIGIGVTNGTDLINDVAIPLSKTNLSPPTSKATPQNILKPPDINDLNHGNRTNPPSPLHIGERSFSNSPLNNSQKIRNPLDFQRQQPSPPPILSGPGPQITSPAHSLRTPLSKNNSTHPSSSNKSCGPPINLSNYYGPLSRKAKSNSTTSSLSELPFPPGFEATIPSPQKAKHEKRRMKKIQKIQKKARKIHFADDPVTSTSLSHEPNKNLMSASDIIELGAKLGLQFNGPLAQLHKRIDDILRRQQADWAASQRN